MQTLAELFSNWVYRYLFFVATFTFETYNTFNFSEECIITTTAYVYTWVDVCTALTVKD